jgi:tetratricopeptide (TPR) repeat protein
VDWGLQERHVTLAVTDAPVAEVMRQVAREVQGLWQQPFGGYFRLREPADPDRLEGDRLLEEKKYDEAAAAYGKAIDKEANLALAWYGLGEVARRGGDLAGAMEDYEEALVYDPDFLSAYFRRGDCLRDLGDLDGAAESYQAVLDRTPFPWAHMSLGRVLQAQGKMDEARKHLEEAAAKEPGNAWARYFLGCLYEEKARAELEEAVRLDPENAEMAERLERLREAE